MSGEYDDPGRDNYRLYVTDKSVPLPIVTAWRKGNQIEDDGGVVRRKRARPDKNKTQRSDIEDYAKYLEEFHEKAMNDYVNGNEDDPALQPADNDELVDEGDDYEDEDGEEQNPGYDEKIPEDPSDTPLYCGASITLAASMLLIMSFAMRHCLTGTALSDLLVLIELHCLVPNLCKKTMTMFVDYFKSIRTPLEFHYYCGKCFLYFGLTKPGTCTECGEPTNKNASYFLIIPLIQQLISLLDENNLMKTILEGKQQRSQEENDCIRDVTDGALYKDLFTKDGYFRDKARTAQNEIHISLQMNTDGVALFRSSSFNIWPVYFVINELPPNLRFTRRNRIFGGLWFGYSKPDFRALTKPIAESLHDLYSIGFTLKDTTIRGVLLSGVFDAPARCLFHKMVQFNGFYGCPYCLAPGETVKTSERGHTHAYPYNRESSDGLHEHRTHEQMVTHATEKETGNQQGQKKNVFGLKGLTWFHFLPKFDMVRGVGIDYMHCVMLGVVKMLTNLWFDKAYRSEMFNVYGKLKQVNERLLNIKPPHFITRLPRTLDDISHFKASEYKTFLLFYSLPCLWEILPDEVFQHYLLLVQAIYMLLSDNITLDQLNDCKRMLMNFVINVQTIYGARYMTSNVHLLLHLSDKVKDLGPLWATSCFYFEDFNGQLRNLFHGTQNIDQQIAFAVRVHQKLPKMSSCLRVGTSEEEFYRKLTEKKSFSTKEYISATSGVIGAFNNSVLSDLEKHSVFLAVGHFQRVSSFKRAVVNNQVIHSRGYRNATKRVSSVVAFQGQFGHIETFVKVTLNCVNADCQQNCACLNDQYLAIINTVNRLDVKLSTDTISAATVPHLTAVSQPTGNLIALPVDRIESLCLYIPVSEQLCFVSVPPNNIEKE